MTAFVVLAIAFQTETICATNCLHPSNNRKPISANIFPSPNATAGFGCFKQQRKRERERVKKLDRQWLERNIVLPGRSQHPLRGCIFHTEIIANVLLCMCFRVSVWQYSPRDHEAEVVRLSGNCFLEVVPLLQTCLIGRTDQC